MTTTPKANARARERRKIIFDALYQEHVQLTRLAGLPDAASIATYMAVAIEKIDLALAHLAAEEAKQPAPPEVSLDA